MAALLFLFRIGGAVHSGLGGALAPPVAKENTHSGGMKGLLTAKGLLSKAACIARLSPLSLSLSHDSIEGPSRVQASLIAEAHHARGYVLVQPFL